MFYTKKTFIHSPNFKTQPVNPHNVPGRALTRCVWCGAEFEVETKPLMDNGVKPDGDHTILCEACGEALKAGKWLEGLNRFNLKQATHHHTGEIIDKKQLEKYIEKNR